MVTGIRLDHLRVLAVSGTDRASFLQGQLTQDVGALDSRTAVISGGADAKGRLQFTSYTFSLPVGNDEAIALVVPAELADDLLKRLRLYVFRAKVQIAILDCVLLGLLDASEPGGPVATVRLPGAGNRHLIVDTDSGTPPAAMSDNATDRWELAEIQAGVPTIVTATVGQFVPQMVNLDLLGAISFSKGCYTGQEIVARMKYLGRVKRRMLRFSAEGLAPSAGTPLYARRGIVGQIARSAPAVTGCEFLAVLTVDDLPGPFFLDEALTQPATLLPLPYEVPEAPSAGTTSGSDDIVGTP
ncbi:MAG: hypothetical protein R3F24_02320 [Gammaproteobacteria bacterium]